MPEIYAIDNKSSNNITFIYDIPNTVNDLSSRVRSLEEENNSENKTKLRRYIPLETTGDIYSYTEGTSGIYGGKPSSINLIESHGVIWDTLQDLYIGRNGTIFSNLKSTYNNQLIDSDSEIDKNYAFKTQKYLNLKAHIERPNKSTANIIIEILNDIDKNFKITQIDLINLIDKNNTNNDNAPITINKVIVGDMGNRSGIINVNFYISNKSDIDYLLYLNKNSITYRTVDSDSSISNESQEIILNSNTLNTKIFECSNIFYQEDNYYVYDNSYFNMSSFSLEFMVDYSKIDQNKYNDPTLIQFPEKALYSASSSSYPAIISTFNTKKRYINNSIVEAIYAKGSIDCIGSRNFYFERDTTSSRNVNKGYIEKYIEEDNKNYNGTNTKEKIYKSTIYIVDDYCNIKVNSYIYNNYLYKENITSNEVTKYTFKGLEFKNLSTIPYEIKAYMNFYAQNSNNANPEHDIRYNNETITSDKEYQISEYYILQPGETKILYQNLIFKINETFTSDGSPFYITKEYSIYPYL